MVTDGMKMHIRRLRVEDASGVARVRVLTWQDAYKSIMPEDVLSALNVEQETPHWQEIIAAQTPENCSFAAEVSGLPGQNANETEIAGYCFSGPERDGDPEYSAEIYAIYVLPQYQGRGIGKRLVQSAVTCLQKHGHKHMLVWVLRDNFPSRKFYEAIGGHLLRERPVETRGVTMPEVAYGYDLVHWPNIIGENDNFIIS